MLKHEIWPLDKFIPYARNPRKNDAAVERMVSAIKEFGFRIPVVAKSDGTVVDGHLRLKAAQRLGLSDVPVVLADELTDVQVKAFRLLANKSAAWAEWDSELLNLELEELQILDFDLELTGFDAEEIESALRINIEKEESNKPIFFDSGDFEQIKPTEEEMILFENKKIIVEFSGGKDSSCASLWCKKFFPSHEVHLLFVDLGADFNSFYTFKRDFCDAIGYNLYIERSKQNIFEMFLDKGKWPGFMHPYCHDLLHESLDTHIKRYSPDEIIIVRGGRLKERGKGGKIKDARTLEVERMKGYVYFQPLYFATKEFGEGNLIEAGLPIWDGYKYGLQRTACRICPGQKPMAFSAIRENFSDVWKELLWLEKRLGLGYWQDPTSPKALTLEQMADRGQSKFEQAEYAGKA